MNNYIIIINNKSTNEKYIHNTNLITDDNMDEEIENLTNHLKLSNPYLEYQKVDDKLEYNVYENVNVLKKGWVFSSISNQKNIHYILELIPVILSNTHPFIEEIDMDSIPTIYIPNTRVTTQPNVDSAMVDKWISNNHIKINNEMCSKLDLLSHELKDILNKPNYGLRKRRGIKKD